jgi:putative transposase
VKKRLHFRVEIDKDVVRCILALHSRRVPESGGPSWLTILGQMKDSLWSVDLFRCESATLRTHWVLVVMDQYTRKVIGFGTHAGIVDGMSLCQMFQRAIRRPLPKYLSLDNDPIYRFHQWQANPRILQVEEINTVAYMPLSHPFVERLIGAIRRKCLDLMPFWTRQDLESKLGDFQNYYHDYRTHAGRAGCPPQETFGPRVPMRLGSYRWRRHRGGSYQTPLAA